MSGLDKPDVDKSVILDKSAVDKYNQYNTFNSGQDDSKHTKGFTIDEAIEHIGFGWTQLGIGLLSGFAWMADGMEINILSILGPTLLCLWQLPTPQEALLTAATFGGLLVGSPVFGNWADKFGRRQMLMLSAVWVLCYGVLTTFSPNLIWLLILRCIYGFGIGGGAQAVTYYSEFLPGKRRGTFVILVEVIWATGGVFTSALALAIMPYGWRIWLLATCSPSLLFLTFSFFMPTSPRFDLACGRNEDARRTLEWLAKNNGKSLPPGELLPEPVAKRGQLKDLIKPEFRVVSGLLAFVWFCCAFLYYGVILFTSLFVIAGDTCQSAITEQDAECAAACETLTPSDYKELIISSASELPALLVTVVLLNLIGPKKTIISCLFIFSVGCGLLIVCMTSTLMLVVLSVSQCMIATVLQVLFLYTPEIYPTEVRALSVGIGSGFGRVGAIITPYVAQVLLGLSTVAGLTFYAVVGLSAIVATYLLPITTKDRQKSKGDGSHQEMIKKSQDIALTDLGVRQYTVKKVSK